ncbi:type II secretion system minor pseudopilin GspK [Caldimonas thermodepolymerans]|uniref:Type II secretion system protein K n=1 Tax=Caldimonas thermodepolymerans TaxID=215580 RepID=A0A2S5T624_9BURK|nr:type II secretion system minor pseudopilin GspK [Caldimonas thermodepolymerans]PPE70450.1 general secretion pathway protein GspK [Caldimonas thermodepolymerans]QPC31117.1 type II secretion system minor pseudopilin GspK [Caldimonas thermodepolymerans]RDH96571.1 type II secretion system protein K (GspK) [Caldimonas thermodepolymerans]
MRATARPAPCSRRRRQRGAALLTAMIIVTLVATLASAMYWRQWRSVQIEIAERTRAQSAWILSGALDWARLILAEDARAGGADHLSEPWATPLAEARLSTFLAANESQVEDAPEAFLTGRITDAQARFNLANLVTEAGELSVPDVAALQRLCEYVNVDPSVATVLTGALRLALPGRAASAAGEGADIPLLPPTVDELRWLGIDDEAAAKLAPYVVLLPRRTPVNLNTAPREVIAAVMEGLDIGSADRLIQIRQRSPFRRLSDVNAHLPQGVVPDDSRVSVATNFFEVRGRMRIEQRVVEERSLVERRGRIVLTLRRERSSFTVGAGFTP